MLHNKKYLYKYVTADTALLILKNRTLKYSSPILFNDPFDTQTKLGFDFEISEFRDALADELYRLIHKEEKPIGINTAPLFSDIQIIWQKVKEGTMKIPKDDFMRKIQTDMVGETESAEQLSEDFNSEWILGVRASRVFSVTEEYDNLLMWAHYTNDHTGATIKFECLPELDTPLCAARKVEYVEKPPVMAKLGEYIKFLTGQGQYPIKQGLFYDMFLSKSKHWAYEKEWRVFIPPTDMRNPPIQEDDEKPFDLKPFYPREIHSIYLGCRMRKSDRQEVSSSS